MDFKFELTEQPAQPVLSVRKRTSVDNLPQELGKAYNEIISYLEAVGEKPSGPAFAAYYNMDMEDLDVEMGFPVSRAIEGRGEIMPGEIPAGKQVSCIYKGPYQDCGPTYEAMGSWITEQGHTATGVAYEFYYNSPMDVPESELVTRIVFPLK